MCGIWFSVGFSPEPNCLSAIEHRGPDSQGWKIFDTPSGSLALGHRRLAIIDTSDNALQPMTFGGGRYWIVFNGEIYNYKELKEELAGYGAAFATQSDTEVLLAAYDVWGEKCLERLLGMFAFVIFDRQRQVAFAARDRFGIKPLYWLQKGRSIAFASEIKQLLCLPNVERQGNVARLFDFISSGMSDHTDETFYTGIFQLKGGHCVTLDIGSPSTRDNVPAIRRWYHLPRPGGLHLSAADAAMQFRDLLTDSVKLHLRSDVAVGSCLSGGLDSSAIVSLAVRQLKLDGFDPSFNTVSACYAEKRVDERLFMEAMVNASRTTPHYIYPNVKDVITQAERITWHQDEPYGSTSIFSQWCVFEEARRSGIKVMLDGQGADEQLAGYHSAFGYHGSSLLHRGQFLTLARMIMERQRYFDVPISAQVKSLITPLLPRCIYGLLFRAQSMITEHDWLNSESFRSLGNMTSAFQGALTREKLTVSDIGDLCLVMTQSTNLPMLLHWEDRNSMAHGVEARVPFLDHRLVEFSIGLGDQHKIVGTETKSVLRQAMRGIMPDKICDRQDKLGFSTPEQEWFRGPLRDVIQEGVADTLRKFPTLLNKKGTMLLINDYINGKRPIDFTLWRIVSVGIWGRVFSVSL